MSQIYGIGNDICDIRRIERLLSAMASVSRRRF